VKKRSSVTPTHSPEEILAAKDFDIDYFGVGPFRFTQQEKLDPVLGIEDNDRYSTARANGIVKPIIPIVEVN